MAKDQPKDSWGTKAKNAAQREREGRQQRVVPVTGRRGQEERDEASVRPLHRRQR